MTHERPLQRSGDVADSRRPDTGGSQPNPSVSIRLVCKACRDIGVLLDEMGKAEFCDCARGETLAEEAEWAATFGQYVRYDAAYCERCSDTGVYHGQKCGKCGSDGPW